MQKPRSRRPSRIHLIDGLWSTYLQETIVAFVYNRLLTQCVRVILPVGGNTITLKGRILLPAVTLTGNPDNRRIHQCPRRQTIPTGSQRILEHSNQRINTTRRDQLVALRPKRLLVRDLVLAVKTRKLLEGGAIKKHVLSWLITQVVHHSQQKGAEDHEVILGTTA